MTEQTFTLDEIEKAFVESIGSERIFEDWEDFADILTKPQHSFTEEQIVFQDSGGSRCFNSGYFKHASTLPGKLRPLNQQEVGKDYIPKAKADALVEALEYAVNRELGTLKDTEKFEEALDTWRAE